MDDTSFLYNTNIQISKIFSLSKRSMQRMQTASSHINQWVELVISSIFVQTFLKSQIHVERRMIFGEFWSYPKIFRGFASFE